MCLRFWSFDSIDGIIRCIHLGWTKYHVTEGLGVKSTTRHGNTELFKAGRLSNLATWQECLARRVSHNHFLQLERLEKPDGEISVSCVQHPQVFFTTGKKVLHFSLPSFICTTTLLVTGCCIYGIGTPKLPVLPSDLPASKCLHRLPRALLGSTSVFYKCPIPPARPLDP